MNQDGGMRKLKAAIVASAVLGLAFTLGACATTPTATPDEGTVQTPDPSDVTDPQMGAAWLDGGKYIALVTYGSSSCVPVADTVTLEGDTISVEFVKEPADQMCTADFAPRATVFAAPEGTDPTTDVTIVAAGFEGEATLAGLREAPAEVPEGSPSAGWFDSSGGFVVLTWGSSSCPPVVDSVEATGDADVAIIFATPDPAQACTRDMAPRATIAYVDGLSSQVDITLLLTGDNITGTTVILGS